jgi:pilus assembly protein CpaB
MERYRHLLLLGAALLVALFASVLVYRALQRRAEHAQATAETRPVAVAMTDLSPGMEVRPEMVTITPFLAKSLPEGSTFAAAGDLAGRVVLYPVRAGEPILASRVTGFGAAGAGVSALVAPGMRAMAVKVDKVIGVSGFLRPDSRVDVLVTLGDPSANGETVTKIVLENQRVLAAGTELEKKPGAEKAVPVDVITLEVTPQDTEKLTLAASSGRIQLALRNLKDADTVLTSGSTVSSLLDSLRPYEEERPAPKAARKKAAPTTARSAPAGRGAAASAAPAAARAPATAQAPATEAAVPQHQVFVIRGLSESVVTFKGGQQ